MKIINGAVKTINGGVKLSDRVVKQCNKAMIRADCRVKKSEEAVVYIEK